MKFKCIKGMADSDNVNVIIMQNDVVIFNESSEGEVLVEGIAGWCKGWELSLALLFLYIHALITIKN